MLAPVAWLGLIPVFAQAPAPGPVDVTNDFAVPAGCRVELWAESPHLFNPTAMDTDARGRIWVTEAVNYRRFTKDRNPGRKHPKGDRIVILEDRDGDGRCDTSKVFAQDEELLAPLGICVLGDRIYVSCSPHVIVYTDSDGDDVPDKKEVLLTGFGGRDHDHAVHSLTPGPDGLLYFNAGNAGPHVVRGRGGFTLRSGSLYGGRNRAGMRSDDGRIWTGGLVMRVAADGTGLEVLAHNFRNPYEVAVDSFGDLWQSDNDDDGNQSTRTLWVMEGGDYGYCGSHGTRSWRSDRRPGQSTWTAHWHADDPGVSPPGYRNGAGGPTGVCMHERGVLNADAGAGVVYLHRRTARGAGFALERTDWIRAKPGAAKTRRWFRPSDVLVGIDGSVFVADWFDAGVGGHQMRDREGYGRILRIVRGRPRLPKLDLTSFAGAVAALRSPAPSVRWLAERRVLAEEAKCRRLLEDDGLGERAYFLAARMRDGGDWIRDRLARERRSQFRVAALRALRRCANRKTLLEVAREQVDSADAAVLREVAILLASFGAEAPPALLERLARRYAGGDRFLLEAIGSAIDASGAGDEIAKRIVGDTDPLEWTRGVAELAWRIHPSVLVPAFRERASSRDLSPDARRRAVDAIAFVPDRAAASAMVDLAQAGPPELRSLAVAWVKQRDANLWRAFRPAAELDHGFEGAEVVFESPWMKRGTKPVDVDIEGAEAIWLVVDAGESFAFDWADWIDPRVTGSAGSKSLVDLRWTKATADWGQVRRNRSAGGGSLSVDGKVYRRGIGTHANSRIAWTLTPGKFDRFRATLAVDDGGARQAGATTKLRFRVLVRRKPDLSWIAPAVARVGAAKAPTEDGVDAAIRRLAESRPGALQLLRQVRGGRLPAAVRDRVGDALRRNRDLGIRALASAALPRRRTDGSALPSIDELAKVDGDPIRGRRLFFESKTQCARCHTHGSRGADIGPDLTAIRTKYGRKALFDAILNPSAGIAFGYDTWLIGTKDDSLYSGFVLVDGPTVLLKDSSGERHRIEASEIDFREKQTVSTMPDNVALGLTASELRDLVAFLRDDPARPLIEGRTVDLLADGLEGWSTVGAAQTWSWRNGVLRSSGKPAGYVRTKRQYANFRLSLEWRFPRGSRPGNSGVLLRTVGKDAVWPKSVEAQLMHRNAGDIWNIGAFPMLVDPLRTQGRRTRKLSDTSENAPGEWNRYEIHLLRGRLELRVNGVLQNVADEVDEQPGSICLQSEGSPIEFRNVRLTEFARGQRK